MNFLKSQLAKIVDLVDTDADSSAEGGHGNGVLLIKRYMSHSKQQINVKTLSTLAQLSNQPIEYTQMFNYIVSKLTSFQYRSKLVKATVRILNVLCYLVKLGNREFAMDLSRNIDVLLSLKLVNIHFYENAFREDVKELSYSLQMIQHRAQYLQRLVNDKDYLEEEREKLKKYGVFLMKTEGDVTVNQLNIQLKGDQKENNNTSSISLKKKISKKSKQGNKVANLAVNQ